MININKKLFQDFLDNKIVVNCQTEKEAVEFLRYCDSQELKWYDKDALSEDTMWNNYENKTVYNCENFKIEYSDINFYKFKKKKKIILYKELLQNIYIGWEIAKMIAEKQLKEGIKFIWHGNLIDNEIIFKVHRGLLVREDSKRMMEVQFLINNLDTGYFTIKEKEYVSFDEARKSGKRFKYKEWNTYEDLLRVLWYLLYKHSNEEANNMLDEKAWEVED